MSSRRLCFLNESLDDTHMKISRTNVLLEPDSKRVLLRPFEPTSEERTSRIIARILALPEEKVKDEIVQVLDEFGGRHRNLQDFFLRRFAQVTQSQTPGQPLSQERKLLIGAYFAQEYALESAALFNPSMVWHPDQTGVPPGHRRFILSLRATGEGHISSITFRSGIIDTDGHIVMDQPTPFVTTPEVVADSSYEKAPFERKLLELGFENDFADRVLSALARAFTRAELEQAVRSALHQSDRRTADTETANGILSLAQSNYEVIFSRTQPLCERVLFPTSRAEMNGLEDARFVELVDDHGSTYYATYTAYDGKVILPQLLETKDFVHFKISTLHGEEIVNKGMALFPRKIKGRYTMLSRQDNENMYIMFSDHIHFWHTKKLLLSPARPWEFVQLGNCGSPIETEAGWLVLSHGVGPVRKYTLGAFLLDLDDPTKVIGRLKEPLLSADKDEREGYVPNVVYSCGGLIHGKKLILPYAVADYATSFAIVDLNALLEELTAS
ncbi:MAG: glycoside hydrolase family 130 protein [bacterium]